MDDRRPEHTCIRLGCGAPIPAGDFYCTEDNPALYDRLTSRRAADQPEDVNT